MRAKIDRRRRARAVLRAFVFILAGTLVGLLFAEVILRVAGISDPSVGQSDVVTGWSGLPGASAWYRTEGEAFVKNNSAGFRDRERSVEKPPGVYRVAMLGDSFTQAMSVSLEKSFTAVAESELTGCSKTGGGPRFEVLNFGIAGFGTAQEYLLLRTRVTAYHPDLVLVAFFTGNDVVDNSRALSVDPLKPYFVLQDGRLILDESFRTSRPFLRQRTSYFLLRWSRAMQIVKRCVRSFESKRVLRLEADHIRTETHSEMYREPTDLSWREAWQVTERLLVAMRDEARSHGSAFAVATLTNGLQVYPDAQVRARLLREMRIETPFYPDDRIRRMGEVHDFPVLNLAPGMHQWVLEHGTALHGFANAFPSSGHWNEQGHRLAGTLLAKWICALAAAARKGSG